MRAISTPLRERPRAFTASRPMDRPPPSSSPPNCRCRLWSSTKTASSMPAPLPTARFTRSSTRRSWQSRISRKVNRPDKLQGPGRSQLDFFRLLRSRHEVHLGSDLRQRRQSLRRHRRSRRDLQGDAEGRSLRILQERRSPHPRARARSQGQPDRRLRRQRPRIPHLARRGSVCSLQRSEEGNHRSRPRSRRQYLCGRRRRKASRSEHAGVSASPSGPNSTASPAIDVCPRPVSCSRPPSRPWRQ